MSEHDQSLSVALLHGWGLNAAVWADLALALNARARVHAPDLPGHGRSASRDLMDLHMTAQGLVEQVPEASVWVGWSYGALLALTVAQAWPKHVRKLVLIGANPRFVQSADWSHAVAPAVFTQFADDLARDYDRTLTRFLSLQLGRGASARPALRRLRSTIVAHGAPSAEALARGLRILGDADLRGTVARVPVPALVIHGARDTLAPIEAGRWLAQTLPHGRLLEIDDAGHAPFLSHSQQVTDAIARFLHE